MQLNYVDAPGAVPATYTLPASQAFELESVSASFDGTSAGGDFLACLSVYSQDGKLIFRAPADQVLAAGDSAEVSFYPLADQASSSTPAASASYAHVSWGSTTLTFGGTTHYVYPVGGAHGGGFSQQGSYSQDGTYGIILPGDGNGVYQVFGWCWNDSGTNWQTKDWKLDLSLYHGAGVPTPDDGYDTRLNYSNAAEGRRNTLALSGVVRVYPASVYGTADSRIALIIDSGVVLPVGDSNWPIEGYFLLNRVGDYPA